jgi:hypothetical protein
MSDYKQEKITIEYKQKTKKTAFQWWGKSRFKEMYNSNENTI